MVNQVQTIEKTSKGWKLQILLSHLALFIFIFLLCGGIFSEDETMGVIGIAGTGAAALWAAIARIGAWWCHG